MVEENSYDTDGSLSTKSKYVYDNKGNQIEGKKYNSDGSFRGKYEFFYDDEGNRIREEFYNNDGSFDRKVEYNYNDKGNVLERKDYIGRSIDTREYVYTNFLRENWVKRESRFDGASSYTKEISYTEREIEYFD